MHSIITSILEVCKHVKTKTKPVLAKIEQQTAVYYINQKKGGIIKIWTQ